MAEKIKYFLLVITLLAFSLGEVVRFQFSNGVAIKALDISVFLFVVLSVILVGKKFKKPRFTKPILIFFFISAVALLINFSNLKLPQFLVSSLYLIRWIVYAGVYLVISNFDKKIKDKISSMLLVDGGIILVGGLAQYFLYPDLRNLYYLGWDQHLYRLFSSFLDPNFAGAFLVLYFLFVLGLLLKRKNLFFGLLLAITLIGIILTFSRSAYIMLFVGLFIFLALENKKKLILIFSLTFVIIVLAFSLKGLKSEGTNLLRITSTQARIPSAKTAIAIFEKNPILGVGFNAYEFASRRYGIVKLESKYVNHAEAGTDNSFLFVLATTGIVGLVAYLFLWTKVLLFAKENVKKNVFSAVLISSVIALFINSLFLNSLFYTFIMFWMWVLVALSED